MRCPFCEAEETKVIDSRLAGDGFLVRRRRECISCNERFTTFESAELVMPRIVKQDGSREQFVEEKLRAGMMRALEKRPVDSETVEAVIGRIKQRAQASGERDIPSRFLGEWVLDELRGLDEVAYVRFASVYLSFQDIDAFRREIARLEGARQPKSVPDNNK